MNYSEMMSMLLLLIGMFFMLLAGWGLIRMPDLFLRMSAATKASTIGVGFMMLAAAVHFSDLGTTSRSLATIVFIFLTAPVAAHRIARAAYFNEVPLWSETKVDELQGQYDERTHILSSDCDERIFSLKKQEE